ncbi:small glutamine-rich tetratricopeptide repeat-containing protein-like [Haemaphysalis longicornis]
MTEGNGKPSTSQGAMPKTTSSTPERLDAAHMSESIARRGYEMCHVGRHRDGIDLFSRAISANPNDHRYFANRSYAYSVLGEYENALGDANIAIHLEPRHPKCHYCRGIALLGLERYADAQQALEKAIQLDPDDEKARRHLREVRVRRIADMGFARDQATWALGQSRGDVELAVEALCEELPSKTDIKTDPRNPGGFRSIWVGSIQPAVTNNQLMRLFGQFGNIHSIRILHDKHCAFINYTEESSAAKAMQEMQGHSLCGAYLVIRFPDRKMF